MSNQILKLIEEKNKLIKMGDLIFYNYIIIQNQTTDKGPNREEKEKYVIERIDRAYECCLLKKL